MSSYVNFQKVYDIDENRSIRNLSTIYDSLSYLKSSIYSIIANDINKQSISSKVVLLKPNWVTHSKKESDELCLRTHDNILLATLEIVLECNPKEVLIGDAPVQGCVWENMLSSYLMSEIKKRSSLFQIPVTIVDFRRRLFDPYTNRVYGEQHPIDEYLIFDLGQDSLLESVTASNKNRFRVILYNSDGFKDTHIPGMHKYCITKRIVESDIIISLPKIKTHQRTCMTGALKNIVGLNGDKDFLPHHRIGGTETGGDCYAGKSLFKYLAELSQDMANRNQETIFFRLWLKLSGLLWTLSFPRKSDSLGAGWYGNDTTWRMVMDLNKIILFGKSDGTIAKEKQRILYSLCDAIIGGEGEGPLKPEPFPMGFISFSNDSKLTDVCFGRLMGINADNVPLLKAATDDIMKKECLITLDGERIKLDDLSAFALSPKLPKGWMDYQK